MNLESVGGHEPLPYFLWLHLRFHLEKKIPLIKERKRDEGGFKTSGLQPLRLQSFPMISLEPHAGFSPPSLLAEEEAKFREVEHCIHCHTVSGRVRPGAWVFRF